MSKSMMIPAAIQRAIAKGNINISNEDSETMELSSTSRQQKSRHEELLRQVEAKRRARTITVPTSDAVVRKRLRGYGQPITLFGERAPDRRERLREVMAEMAVAGKADEEKKAEEEAEAAKKAEDAPKKAYLVAGDKGLIEIRKRVASYSFPRAKDRVTRQRHRLIHPEPNAEEKEAKVATDLLDNLKSYTNLCSEIGDKRPISSCMFSPDCKSLVTSSWSGLCKLWTVPDTKLQAVFKGGDDRVTDVVFHPEASKTQAKKAVNIATCSVDKKIRLFAWPEPKSAMDTDEDLDEEELEERITHMPIATLEGHTARCSRLAFHPSGQFMGSTSYDKTWKLWDLTTQKCCLTQKGHSRATYGLAFQCDGSLLATGDLGGNARLWDLRSGKSILPLKGHTKQILAMDFHPNGFMLATGSDDHTVRVWDLRKKRCLYTIAAHSNLVSGVRWQPGDGRFLVTSSYDGTAKMWSGSDFTLLRTLAGHEGRVMRAEISPDSSYIATAAFDRTFKLWANEENE